MHTRRSIRLRDYDYRQNGAYFVTICTHQRACTLGSIRDGVMHVNDWGTIVADEWNQTAVLRSYIELDAFVVMPNHVHGILVITGSGVGSGMMHHATTTRTFGKPIAHSLPSIIGQYKAAVTRQINRQHDGPASPIWQRNYYEHIIRSGDALQTIRQYIEANPAQWRSDSLHPAVSDSSSSVSNT
jgi:REP element-mobilizing transposase RayT